MKQLKAASIAYQPPLIALKHLVNSPDNYTSDREGFVLCNDMVILSTWERFCLYHCDHRHAPTHGYIIVLKLTLVVNLCLPSTHHCSLQPSLALCDVTYMWVTWGEPLAQENLSPGKAAMAAKLPRISRHSSITE